MGEGGTAIEGRYCLIGADVSASPSPAMMNAAFSHYGIDERYFAQSLASDQLAERIGGLKRAGVRGLNVTIPFKTSIIPLLDGLDTIATRVGAVNVVKAADGGSYVGYNSDVDGIIRPLRERSLDLGREGRRAMLVGAGGAARAFVEAMGQLGCSEVIVLVRDPARAAGFLGDMERAHPETDLQLFSLEHSSAVKGHVDLLFNATPVGSSGRPVPSQLFRFLDPETTVFDAVYRPVETELVRAAETRGCRVIPGYEMLLNQGAVAFELWTGRIAPTATMREAILNHLREGGDRR